MLSKRYVKFRKIPLQMCCVVDIYRAASVGVGVQGADTRQFFDSRQMALNSRDVVDAYSSVIVCVSRNYIKQFALSEVGSDAMKDASIAYIQEKKPA